MLFTEDVEKNAKVEETDLEGIFRDEYNFLTFYKERLKIFNFLKYF